MSRLMGTNGSYFRKEQCIVIFTFVSFDFGYFIRFLWDKWHMWTLGSTFTFWIVANLVILTDGVTLLLLLYLHR